MEWYTGIKYIQNSVSKICLLLCLIRILYNYKYKCRLRIIYLYIQNSFQFVKLGHMYLDYLDVDMCVVEGKRRT